MINISVQLNLTTELLHNQKNNVHPAQSPVSVTRCFEFFSYKAISFS